MKCFSKSYFRILFALLFSCVFFFLSSVNGYCTTTSSGVTETWTDEDKNAYLLLNLVDLIPAAYDFIVQGSGRQALTQEIFDLWTQRALEQEMSFNEWINRNTTWFYLKDTSVHDENTLESIQLSPAAAQDIQLAINNYIAENPLGYTECYLASYNMLNADIFSNYAQFSAVKEFIKNQNGYVLTYAMYTAGTYTVYACVIPKSMDIGFFGTTTQGIFNNVSVAINWQVSQIPWTVFSNVDLYTINPDGSTIKWSSGYYPSVTGLQNLTNVPTAQQKWNVFSNTSKSELVYVFDNLNAYKNYNAGAPQPYYMGSNFGTYNTTTYNVRDNRSMDYYYNQVVDNSKTGMTPEEVQKLIEEILRRTGGGSGGGSGGSDDNDPDSIFGWIAEIGTLLKDLIKNLGSAIKEVISGIVDAITDVINLLVGYTDDQGVHHDGLLGRLVSLINGGFNDFLSDIFSWLPPEIVTIFTASIVISIFFGIWKIIRG